MSRYRASLLFAFVSILGMLSPLIATAQTATIEGVARAIDGGANVPFALVRLLPADSSKSHSDNWPQGITSADGRYWFNGLAAGKYRVQLLRIGFRPVLSEPIQVNAGETVQLPIRVASEPLTLPVVTVRPDACVTGKALAELPQIETLWQQAARGASTRLAMMAAYRFRRMVREESREVRADGPLPLVTLDQSMVSDPSSATGNAGRRRAQRLSSGYYGSNDGWWLPDELDLLHEDFLKGHCLAATVERRDGEFGLTFRPLRARRDFLDVRGTIWLDSATFLARQIDLEYVNGEDSRGTARLDFADVAVAGSMLRMPVGAVFSLRSSRKNPAKRAEGKITYLYSDFVEVRTR